MAHKPYKEWNFYKASQVIPLALNDPNDQLRPLDFFTLDWGDTFTHTALPPESMELESTTVLSDFKPYFQYTARLQKRLTATDTRHKKQDVRNGIKKDTLETNEAEFSRIPSHFFSPLFKLHALETFNDVIPWIVFEPRSTNRSGWSILKKPQKRSDNRVHLLRTQLTHYLDVIETKLAHHVSRKSDDFFKILESQEKVLRAIREVSYNTRTFRTALHSTCDISISNKLRVFLLARKKKRLSKMCEKMKLMSLVHQTLSTIQAQQVAHDHVAALELITTTKDVLRSDLPGLHCFRQLSLTLSSMGGVIEDKLEGEFTKLFFETVSLFGISGETEIADSDFEEQVAILIARLAKQNRVEFLTPLKDAIPDVMRSKFQQCLKSELGNEAELEEAALSQLIQQLPYQEWVRLLSRVFSHLLRLTEKMAYIFRTISSSSAALNPDTRQQSVGLRGPAVPVPSHRGAEPEYAHIDFMNDTQLDLRIQNIVAASADVINSSSSSADPTECGEAVAETDLSLSREQVLSIHGECVKLLESATDTIHLRCSHLVGLRGKSGQFEKLTSQEFITLVQTLESFISRSQSLSNCSCPHLRSVLLAHSKKFLEQFHEERLKKLSLLLDQEQWVQQDVPCTVQCRVNRLQDGLISEGTSTQTEVSFLNEESKPTLTLKNRTYPVVGTLLLLLNMITDYCSSLQDLPSLTAEILTKLVKLIEFFNTKSCRLVLGAGGLPTMGIKSITAKHLGLVQRCLEVLSVVLPLAEECFLRRLTDKQKTLMTQFERARTAIHKHQEQIHVKLIDIMDETFQRHLSSWEVSPEQPSPPIKSITKQMSKLHEALRGVFTPDQVETLFVEVVLAFTKRFSARLCKLSRSKVVVKDHVIENELGYVHNSISSLQHLKNLDLEYFQVTFE